LQQGNDQRPIRSQAGGAALAWAVLPLLTCCTLVAGESPASFRAVFLPHWIPQAQFAGYYMAAEKGFYRQQGLEVELLEGGPRKRVGEALVSGRADFASHFLSAALKLRDEGIPVVHLAQITQRSALLLVAHKSHGIESVKDLDGKKVSLWADFTAQPNALFRKYNLRVNPIPQSRTINLFMRGAVDAASAMWHNEYHLFLNSGLNEDEVTVFFFDKYGLNFPEDSIICLRETWRTRPEICRKFVAATLEGWRYVLSHREEALETVMKRAEKAQTGTNRSHQRWMLDRMCELIQPVDQGVAMGELSRDAYERVARELKSSGQLQTAPAFEDFHAPVRP
jgi:NitT/TauT family transport system substrate-binding protein